MINGLRETIGGFDERMARRFQSLEERMDRRFEQVDRRFEQVDRRFEHVDHRFDTLDAKMSRQFTWIVGLQVTTLIAVLGAIFSLMQTLISH